MQNFKKTADGFVPDTKTPEEFMLTGKPPRLQEFGGKNNMLVLNKTKEEMKKELRSIAEKIGATVASVHDLPEVSRDFFVMELDLDGGEQVDWTYPLVKGGKGVEVDENVPF